MIRPVCAFLVVFSILSLIVGLNGLGSLFAVGAIILFGLEKLVEQSFKSPRASTLPREPLL